MRNGRIAQLRVAAPAKGNVHEGSGIQFVNQLHLTKCASQVSHSGRKVVFLREHVTYLKYGQNDEKTSETLKNPCNPTCPAKLVVR